MPTPPPEFAAYFALLEVSSLVQHGVEHQLREDGDLSFVQFQILAVLEEALDGTQTMTALADRLVLSRSGLTYQAHMLERAGLLTRAQAVDDERSKVLALSDAGRRRLSAVLPGHMEVVRDILLDPLTAADRAELTRLLDKVRTHMRARPPRSAQRAAGPARARATGSAD
ncbi:MarR family winged helix-turn-helix transcriptional regulator [Nocardioides sp. cx-173]|uniref:MarR family winged helix-turn-helix transcriptional regulator n=1 Tax=Nocardioides sp. cx-173 TaxID=2898796 RepID=UPI001E49EF83|nr:MarR family transcriptional regulator [Nocardioides sp. cx-173]MCD4523392.1 MarR family transcriptional regulator [Nocardioides sp. cx-173]UGB42269.1 MarR family transcriptional regulator [Nocardioides sp. cx-173]